MRLALVLALLMCAAGLVLALQNPAAADVRFLLWRFDSSLALVLLVAFAAGLLAGLLLMLPGRIRASLAAAGRKREVDDLQRRLADCEGKLAEKEAAADSVSQPSPESAGSHKPPG